MNDFIKLFSQELVTTIEGLMGATPTLDFVSQSKLPNNEIHAPYAITTIQAKGDFEATLAILTPVNLATALADTMVGGEGNSKESMDDDDLDAIKEINSNIFGALSTNLGSQKTLPKLSFSCTDINFIANDTPLTSYAQNYHFNFTLNTIDAPLFLLTSQEFENNFSNPQAQKSPAMQEIPQEINQNLSAEEMKNISMLLDVKLNVKVRIGQKKMLLKDVISMDIGSVIELNQLANEPLEILIDDKVIAKGEVVIVDGNFGIQVTEIGTKRQRLEQLRN